MQRAGRSYTPPGPASDPWGPYIREASAKYDVPEKWIREVMRQESGGNLYSRGGSLITSGAGAMGLMQVMPATYDELRARYRELGDDPYDPHNNVLAGAAYIREMYDIYGAPGFLAAYNAGPGRLDDYLTRNRTLPLETRRYVASIGPRINGYEPQKPSPGAMYAMNAIPLDIPAGPRYPSADTQFASLAPLAVPAAPIVLAPRVPAYNPAVEVAEAQPETPRAASPTASDGPFIKLRPQQESVLVADAAPARPFVTLNAPVSSYEPPEPVAVADARTPIKLNPPTANSPLPNSPLPNWPMSGSLLAEAPRFTPAPPTRMAYAARPAPLPIPEPPEPPPSLNKQFARRGTPSGSRPIEVAEFPEPPRAPARFAAASELVPTMPRGRGFSLIPTATAAPIHKGAGPFASTSGGWAVQVGAFANQSLAQSATVAARQNARDVLGGAHSVVAGVRQPGGTLYRARLGGLSRDAAAEACERLSRARTNCMVVSPDAQR